MLGNSNNEAEKNFINVKLVSQTGPTKTKPVFVLQKDFKDTDETYTNITGKLIKIKSTFTEGKGGRGDVKGFKAFFEDGDNIVVLESTITNASKDLLNGLIPNIGKTVEVFVYLNKNEYPTGGVKIGNDFAPQSLDFKAVDKDKLFELVKELEEKEVKLEESKNKNEEVSVEDTPF